MGIVELPPPAEDPGKESSLVTYARDELERAGLFDMDSDFEGKIGHATLQLVKIFSTQGHSGTSASIVVKLTQMLLTYTPLTPLTYEEDEWNDVSDKNDGKPLWQNKRDFKVFSEDHGAHWYNLEGAKGTRGMNNHPSVSGVTTDD